MKTKPISNCQKCGRELVIYASGMCQTCYNRDYRQRRKENPDADKKLDKTLELVHNLVEWWRYTP